MFRHIVLESRTNDWTSDSDHFQIAGVGDPIEVRSILETFGGPQRDSLLHFGSIKGNIGHTEATAGISGLVKVLLMMKHHMITTKASHTTLNPKIPNFERDQMCISRENIPWKASNLVACVNSYGAAGSNSALIVREGPSIKSENARVKLSKYPLFLSAGSLNTLSQYSKKLLDWLSVVKPEAHSNFLSSLSFNLAQR